MAAPSRPAPSAPRPRCAVLLRRGRRQRPSPAVADGKLVAGLLFRVFDAATGVCIGCWLEPAGTGGPVTRGPRLIDWAFEDAGAPRGVVLREHPRVRRPARNADPPGGYYRGVRQPLRSSPGMARGPDPHRSPHGTSRLRRAGTNSGRDRGRTGRRGRRREHGAAGTPGGAARRPRTARRPRRRPAGRPSVGQGAGASSPPGSASVADGLGRHRRLRPASLLGQPEDLLVLDIATMIDRQRWHATALWGGIFALVALVVGVVVLARPAFGAPGRASRPRGSSRSPGRASPSA
ncbi:hypothetical protein SFUMM280S_02451 [Streptomyces fumanus]